MFGVLELWLIIWILKNAAMDVATAATGKPNPRYELKKAKARAAGQNPPAQPRYGTRDWLNDLIADGLQAQTEHRRRKAAARRAARDDVVDADEVEAGDDAIEAPRGGSGASTEAEGAEAPRWTWSCRRDGCPGKGFDFATQAEAERAAAAHLQQVHAGERGADAQISGDKPAPTPAPPGAQPAAAQPGTAGPANPGPGGRPIMRATPPPAPFQPTTPAPSAQPAPAAAGAQPAAPTAPTAPAAPAAPARPAEVGDGPVSPPLTARDWLLVSAEMYGRCGVPKRGGGGDCGSPTAQDSIFCSYHQQEFDSDPQRLAQRLGEPTQGSRTTPSPAGDGVVDVQTRLACTRCARGVIDPDGTCSRCGQSFDRGQQSGPQTSGSEAGGAPGPEQQQPSRPTAVPDTRPDAVVIPFRTTYQQEEPVSTDVNTEVVGLDQSIAYAHSLKTFAGEHATAGNEGYIGHLVNSKVEGQALQSAYDMQAAFTAASEAAETHALELEKQRAVQEAYANNSDAGDKSFQTEGR